MCKCLVPTDYPEAMVLKKRNTKYMENAVANMKAVSICQNLNLITMSNAKSMRCLFFFNSEIYQVFCL